MTFCIIQVWKLISLIICLSVALGKKFLISPDPENDLACVEPCYTLQEVSAAPDYFFAPNTILFFHAGVHTGSNVEGYHLLISNTANVSLIGSVSPESETTIECEDNFGLAFVNVSSLTLWNIRFLYCGANVSDPIANYISNSLSKVEMSFDYFVTSMNYTHPHFRSTLYMVDVLNLHISGLQIKYSERILGINLVGDVNIVSSILSVNVLLIADDSVATPVNTTIYIMQAHLINAYGFTATLYQHKYNIFLDIQHVDVYESLTLNGGIALHVDLCHNSISMNDVNFTRGLRNKLVIYLWNVDDWLCAKNGEITVTNCYFQDGFGGAEVLISNWPSLSIQGLTFIQLTNITFQDVSAALEVSNIASIIITNMNITKSRGVLIQHKNSEVVYDGSNYIMDNNAAYWGVMFISKCNVTFRGNTKFYQNNGFYAGVIYSKKSTIVFDGNTIFDRNEGLNGGAMALYEFSFMDIRPNATVLLTNNHALSYGGGLYVGEDNDYEQFIDLYRHIACFFQPSIIHVGHGNVIFRNNTADVAGSELYGGWGDICIIYIPTLNLIQTGEEYFNEAFHFPQNSSDPSLIASNAARVCVCTDEPPIPNCAITAHNMTSYPGGTLHLLAVTTGQRFGIVPSAVEASGNTSVITNLQQLQTTQNHCTELSYTVASSRRLETFYLSAKTDTALYSDLEAKLSKELGYHHNDLITSWFATLSLNVFLLPCPLGFTLDLVTNKCDCEDLLKRYEINCSIDTQSVYRKPSLWIYGLEAGVVVHEHCPLGYCKPNGLDLNLERPDDQCAFHHSGILCGRCQKGFSQVLGSLRCKHCSNWWLLVLAPLGLAGLALVILLISLNITVSVGTINGLLFYANIVQANQAIFFPSTSRNTITAVITAWLNLDVGVELCVFNGMDAYTKTWLQFLFPFYIWIIVIVIIVSSHYSTRAAKLSSRNAVPVLATLFLLSYTKMLRVFTTVLSFTFVYYPNGQRRKVWLYDGNVEYLEGKHVALFVAILLITCTLTVPYTVFLLFVHIFQSKSNYIIFKFWVPKMLPLIDAHTGPYLPKHRYWTGILLVLRVALILVFSVNILGDPAINLLAIVITVLCLFIYLTLFGSMYRSLNLTRLEFFYHANLLLTAVVTLFTRHTGGNQQAVAHIFVSLALVGFIGILCYHLFLKLKFCSAWTKLKAVLRPVSQDGVAIELALRDDTTERAVSPQPEMKKQPKHINFCELREPLLSD